MSSAKTIAKSTGLLFSTEIFDKLLSFLLVIVITRYLGSIGFGKYSFIFAFISFAAILSNLGLTLYIFREIAKDLTFYYDPGVFTNITGLYFIKIPSFDTIQLFSLLTILNSQFMNSVFKTLFSTLHMSGGYLRINGSFIKRLPLPKKLPAFLSQLGKILQLLSQLRYKLISKDSEFVRNIEFEKFIIKYYKEINTYHEFFNNLANSLVKLLFLDDFYLESNINYNILRDLLDLKNDLFKIPYKFFIPQFNIRNYKVYSLNELNSIIIEINKLYNQLCNNTDLLNQVDNIIKNNFN